MEQNFIQMLGEAFAGIDEDIEFMSEGGKYHYLEQHLQQGKIVPYLQELSQVLMRHEQGFQLENIDDFVKLSKKYRQLAIQASNDLVVHIEKTDINEQGYYLPHTILAVPAITQGGKGYFGLELTTLHCDNCDDMHNYAKLLNDNPKELEQVVATFDKKLVAAFGTAHSTAYYPLQETVLPILVGRWEKSVYHTDKEARQKNIHLTE